jgi:hypothetical protein
MWLDIKNPSKNNLILFSLIWLISNGLLIISLTDLFSESFFQKKYFMIYLPMVISTYVVLKLFINYLKLNKNH